MMQGEIMSGEEPLVGRNADDRHASRPEYPGNLRNRFEVVFDVFENVRGEHRVKAGVAERESGSATATVLCLPTDVGEPDCCSVGFDAHHRTKRRVRGGISPATAAVIEYSGDPTRG